MTSVPTTLESPAGPPATSRSTATGGIGPPAALVGAFARVVPSVGRPVRVRAAWRRAARSAAWLQPRRDPLLTLSLAVALPVVVVDVVDPLGDIVPSLVLTAAFVGAQVGLSAIRNRPRWLPSVRFGLCLAFLVGASLAIDIHGGWPLLALGIPVVALAAAFGEQSMWVATAAIGVILVPIGMPTTAGDVRRRLIALAMAALITAVGSRWVVTSLARSRDRLRRAQQLQRRRSRQLAAVERVGRILAEEGPTPQALDSVAGLLLETFGYRYPSIYTWDGASLRLGAQRNYLTPIEAFPTELGVIGRVARTRQPAFLPDVTIDPDYVAADNGVRGEISVPLLDHGELLGVLNIETDAARPLDDDDFGTLTILADRVSASLALGHERQKLTERARLMDALVSFSRSLGGSLDPKTVHQQVAVGAARVIGSDMALLVLRDPATSDFRAVEVEGGDPGVLGIRILPGEGVTGRAIRDGTVVVEDRLGRGDRPTSAAGVRLADTVAAMSVPLRPDQGVIGALSWFREDLARPFTNQEREVAALLGSQVALAIVNADLHHATEVAAVTDGLTGLHNRRHFDASIERMDAARQRLPVDERIPRSVIMFDLDHFGRINKLHGHRVGDRILQAFAEVVRRRVRSSDLVARYGGEEFVVVLDGAGHDDAVRLAEEIRVAFAGIGFGLADGSAVGCTVSAGCASLAASETASSLLIERADVGLAMAKSSGRDRVVAA